MGLVTVQNMKTQQTLLLTLVIPHINVIVIKTGAFLWILVTLELGQQCCLARLFIPWDNKILKLPNSNNFSIT